MLAILDKLSAAPELEAVGIGEGMLLEDFLDWFVAAFEVQVEGSAAQSAV